MYFASLESVERSWSDSASCCCFSNCLVIYFFERDQNQDELNGLCNCIDNLFELRHTQIRRYTGKWLCFFIFKGVLPFEMCQILILILNRMKCAKYKTCAILHRFYILHIPVIVRAKYIHHMHLKHYLFSNLL